MRKDTQQREEDAQGGISSNDPPTAKRAEKNNQACFGVSNDRALDGASSTNDEEL